jgi:hypothetical protein
MKEQCSNRRSNRVITAFSQTRTLEQWAQVTGLKPETIARRLNSGWPAEKALSTLAESKFNWRRQRT